MSTLLSKTSDAWKNKVDNKGLTLVLYSCRTGAVQKNADGKPTGISVAQKISASKEFKDVEVIAPNQRIYFNEDGPIGTYEAAHVKPDDEY